MPGSGRRVWFAIGVLAAIAVPVGAVFGKTAEPVLLADIDGGGGVNIDLAVRQVTVARCALKRVMSCTSTW